MPRRALAFAVLGVDVDGHRVARPAPGAVIDGIAPEPPSLGPTATRFQHRQRGVVGEHFGRRQHGADQQIVERLQPPAGASHPVGQRRTIERDALSREDLHLAIKRLRVGELADHHVRDQCLGGHPAIDRPVRRGRDHHDILATPADVARPARDPDPQLRRHDVELLGAEFADRRQRDTAARAVAVLDVDHHLVARQVRRQRAVVASRRLGAGGARRAPRLLCRLVGGDGLLEVLEPELQLIEAQLLGAATELMAQQTLDEQPQLVVLGMQVALLQQHGPQHLLQGRGVVRQGVGIDLHDPDGERCAPRRAKFKSRFVSRQAPVERARRAPATRTRRGARPAAAPTARCGPSTSSMATRTGLVPAASSACTGPPRHAKAV